MNNKKGFISLALASMISVGLLTGCSAKDTQAKISSEIDTQDGVKQIEDIYYFEQYDEVPETKIFEPGQHVIFMRYNYTGFAYDFKGGSVAVPEGYMIMDIENYTYKIGNGSQTRGADIWYVNTETVLVQPVYKDDLQHGGTGRGYYDYSLPGTVIENDKDNEMKLVK